MPVGSFEVESFLNRRVDNPDFTMVEIGYGRSPIFDQQPHHFTGSQRYFGIEAGLRDRTHAAAVAVAFEKQVGGRNIEMLIHDVGPGEASFHCPDGIWDEVYIGEYDPKTDLPDEIADEVVASNVFCDPLIAACSRRTHDLLTEMCRLAKPSGVIVLRETITPEYVEFIDEYSVGVVGLNVAAKVTPSDWQDWHELEIVYGTNNNPRDYSTPFEGSYYLFLTRK